MYKYVLLYRHILLYHHKSLYHHILLYHPVQYNWVKKMVYIGREIIGIEYLGVTREVGWRNLF